MEGLGNKLKEWWLIAKVAGCDVLVKVSKTDGTYTTIGGQTSATLNRSADTIDVTDKTNNG